MPSLSLDSMAFSTIVAELPSTRPPLLALSLIVLPQTTACEDWTTEMPLEPLPLIVFGPSTAFDVRPIRPRLLRPTKMPFV